MRSSLQHTPLPKAAVLLTLPDDPLTSLKREFRINDEKALQQVLSVGTKGVHPLICLLDDLTGTLATWLGWAASLWGKAARGREESQRGHASTAVAGDHRAYQRKAGLLSQRKDARLGEKQNEKEREGGRRVF